MLLGSLRAKRWIGWLGAGVTGLLGSACDDAPENPPSSIAPPPRLENTPLVPQDRWLDDFEDGDLFFRLSDGDGHWASGEPGAPTLRVAAEGANGTAFGLLATGDAPAGFSAILAATGTPSRAHDYSTCSGLELWAKLDSSLPSDAWAVTLSLESSTGRSDSTLTVTREWQRFSRAWSDFSAPSSAGGSGGAGTAGGETSSGGSASTNAPFDPKSLERIRFANPLPTGLWIDEVKLKDCRLLDLNPPIPEPAPLGSEGPPGSPVARYGQLKVQGNRLLDQTGNPVQLKGVSSMWLNWETEPYAENQAALGWMRDNWNLSVVRAALGVEPSNAYLSNPKARLAQVTQIVDHAVALGVYVIIDWHVSSAGLYPAEARAFFQEIAQSYGQHPNVIYEPFNEPTGLDWSSAIKPYHEAVVATIRGVDPDNLIVLGTPQWSQRVDQAAEAPIGGSNLLYALHFYACTHGPALRQTGDAALARGLALFVTEFGATNADGGRDGQVCADEARLWFDWMAQNGVSGAAWRLDACAGEASCMLVPGAPVSGGFADRWLGGHGPLVRDWLSQ